MRVSVTAPGKCFCVEDEKDTIRTLRVFLGACRETGQLLISVS